MRVTMPAMAAAKPRFTNRLVGETSPYLQQHAHNPVQWYPWGEEALKAAREQDRPILLSIGYSSCHWCHVMERESFENENVARTMNEHFINIKVDREERPDLDSIYMNFVQMTTGAGGWPLTVFLTADQVPFYGGTYFPPEDRYGRPGFKRILEAVAEAFRSRRQEIDKNRQEILRQLQQAAGFELGEGRLSSGMLEECVRALQQQFDHRHGGFGGAPKFPSSMVLGFLLRYARQTGSQAALHMVETSLLGMARGGLFDHLAGGFHRYSVDDSWLVPHFEKMLYDNALLARLYLEAWQFTGRPEYRSVAEQTLEYVQRDMRDASGGFYSAEDADSEGEEGRYYVWSADRIESVLGKERARLFNECYGVSASGNFEGKNILHLRTGLDELSQTLKLPLKDLRNILCGCREELLRVRDQRIRPGKDDKSLCSWNGMMLSAFADAALALNRRDFRDTAVGNAEFLATQMQREGKMLRTWKNGRGKLNGYLEDYALAVQGWLQTYQLTGDLKWLELAGRLTESQFSLFWDQRRGDFYFTSEDHEELLVRQKEYLDNATPSGNSVTCLNLLKLAILSGDSGYRERAGEMLSRVGPAAARHPLAFGNWLQALWFYLNPVHEIALVGKNSPREALLEPVRRLFVPNKVLAQAETVTIELAEKVPLLKGKTAAQDGASAYVCHDFTCRAPVTTAAELERLLQEPPAH